MKCAYFTVTIMLALADLPSLAAPAPPQPPLRKKEPPVAWKLDELNALFPNPDDKGPVNILVWEIIDTPKPDAGREERCLVIKKYAERKDQSLCALGYFQRFPDDDETTWKPSTSYLTGVKPGEPNKKVGVEGYQSVPDDEEIAKFLERKSWKGAVDPYEVTVRGRGITRSIKIIIPKVVDGGVNIIAWKKVFDRNPPSKLFPELQINAQNDKK